MIINNFRHIQQPTKNSCWIACAAMVINHFAGLNYTVQHLANSYGLDLDQKGSPIELIRKVFRYLYTYQEMPMDGFAVPTVDEIAREISGANVSGVPRPLLCCVGTDIPPQKIGERTLAVSEYKDGHWILIIGIDCVNNKYLLTISDPEENRLIRVIYDSEKYLRYGLYYTHFWENTTYFNF